MVLKNKVFFLVYQISHSGLSAGKIRCFTDLGTPSCGGLVHQVPSRGFTRTIKRSNSRSILSVVYVILEGLTKLIGD